MKITKKDKDLIWASGTFLVTELPEDFSNWSEEQLNEFLEHNAWEPIAGSEGSWIWEQIENLAASMRDYVKKKN